MAKNKLKRSARDMDSNILRRYFSGKYSRKDYIAVKDTIFQGDENPQMKEIMNEHWMEFDAKSLPDVPLGQILDRIQHRIYIEENSKKMRASFWLTVQRVAAILFLPLLISSLVFYNWRSSGNKNDTSWAEIQCPLGVRTRFHLPDGSTGYLNSGSVLKYPVAFANNRNVNLSGEGYFEVLHNEKSPFHVRTKNIDVKVLGTTFNVVAYEGEKTEEIVLQSGHVNVSDLNGRIIGSLTPDQRLVLDKVNWTTKIGNIKSEQYTSWKDGKLMFRNANIEDLAIRLSRWYNAEVIVDDKDSYIKAYTYHGTFVDERLDDVLKVLTISSPIKYVEFNRKSDQDGIYFKRKIILSTNPLKIKEFEKKN